MAEKTATRQSSPTTHTVKSLSQFFESDVAAAIQKHYSDRPCQVMVRGVLGELPETNYQIYYGIQLRDGTDNVLLNIKKTQASAANLEGGEYVSVIGTIKTELSQYTRNRVELRIDVGDIWTTDSPEAVEAMRQDQATISKLKSINPVRHQFPFGRSLRVSILLAKQSQVQDDFLHEINRLGNLVSTEFITVNMTDRNDIVEGIKSAHGDVLTIIRGGGDAEQFEVFNSVSVITAINSYPGYRVLGLGHSGNATLADLVCDYSANTPAQAGGHIREIIENYQLQLSKQTEELSSGLKQLTDELDSKQAELDYANTELSSFIRMIIRHWKAIAGTAVALVALVVYLVR